MAACTQPSETWCGMDAGCAAMTSLGQFKALENVLAANPPRKVHGASLCLVKCIKLTRPHSKEHTQLDATCVAWDGGMPEVGVF